MKNSRSAIPGIARLLAVTWLLSACGAGTRPPTPEAATSPGCSGNCASASTFLTVADVERVLAQGISEARLRGVNATFAVSDRVGNILAVYRMTGANPGGVVLTSNAVGVSSVDGGLEGIILPGSADSLAAIAKAITGAYLSSEGNGFSTRTAGQIVQDHFNPGEDFQPGGPLFGVQFSQLACSDLTNSPADGSVGPKQSPLGLAADPGGFPLYKNGTVVGGIGVIADGRYSLDKNLLDRDSNLDEQIALAASFGLAAPADRRADQITVEGKTLRFSDAQVADLVSIPDAALPFTSLASSLGGLVAVPGYFDGVQVQAGTAFGQPASGIRADTGSFADLDAFVLVDAANQNRFAPRDGSEAANALSAAEVTRLLRNGLSVAQQARAQIRQPLNSRARVTVSVVDSNGTILGLVRSRDAPIFGSDVAVQKARSAVFFSANSSANQIASLPPAIYLAPDLSELRSQALTGYVTDLRIFTGQPDLLSAGQFAFSARAIGNLARPFYPDGINASPPGPLSKTAGQWSVFSTGLQLDLAINAIVQHVAFAAGLIPTDVNTGCLGKARLGEPDVIIGNTLANGLQIFPGGVPIYRGNTLIGAIGVSGDGIDQDDMIASLALYNTSQEPGATLGHAARERRSDQLEPQGVRLRYVQCPQAPFINSNLHNVCAGI